jgi:hypothetical protein
MKVRQTHVLAGKRRTAAFLLALAALAWVAGPTAAAKKHVSPLTTILNTKIHADPGPVPEFVEKSRPSGGAEYIPLHASDPERHAKPKTAAELKAMEMDLDAAAAGNRRRAGQSGAAAAAEKSGKISAVRSGSVARIH